MAGLRLLRHAHTGVRHAPRGGNTESDSYHPRTLISTGWLFLPCGLVKSRASALNLLEVFGLKENVLLRTPEARVAGGTDLFFFFWLGLSIISQSWGWEEAGAGQTGVPWQCGPVLATSIAGSREGGPHCPACRQVKGQAPAGSHCGKLSHGVRREDRCSFRDS